MARIAYTALGSQSRPSPSKSWRPPWLRRRTFAVFIAIFLTVTGLISGLYGHSTNSNGLATARQAHEWLWRFGPVAIFTVVAAFWARVEYQAMRYQPWISLLQYGHSDDEIYHLDYTDMILPVAIVNSARNGHLLVLLALVTGIFIKIQLVLAPALLHLTVIDIPIAVPLTVHDGFVEPSQIRETLDPRPYYTFHGASEYNHSLPFGIDSHISYQTFSQIDDGGILYDRFQAPIEAEVDALAVDLHCLPLGRCDSTVTDIAEDLYTARYSFHFEGCGENSGFLAIDTTQQLPDEPGDVTSLWFAEEIIPGAENSSTYTCDSITRTNYPFAIVHIQRHFLDTNKTAKLHDANVTCHGITCASDTWITKALVTDYGSNRSVHVIDRGYRRPLNGDKVGWFNYVMGSSFPDLSPPDLHITATDRVFPLGWMVETGFISPDFQSQDWHVITDGLERFYNALGPAVGHFRMKSAKQTEIQGRQLIPTDRLVVDKRIAVAIASLSGTAGILATWMLLAFALKPGVFERDPATILGSAAYLARLTQLPSQPVPKPKTALAKPSQKSRACCLSQPNDNHGWGQVSRYPLPLKPGIRFVFVMCLAALVGTLVALVVKSWHSQTGIGTVDNEESLRLYWTVVPALAMFIISTYVQSCNFQLRRLSIFTSLAVKDTPATFLDVSLLDMVSPVVFYQSIRMRFFNVALSEVLAILATLPGMFAAVLYTTTISPGVRDTLVNQTDVFYSLDPPADNDVLFQNRVSLDSLLMSREEDSIVYPRDTYRDLVFPSLDIRHAAEDTHSENTSAVVTVTGLQLEQECSYVSRSELQFEITGNSSDRVLRVFQKRTCANGDPSEVDYGFYGDGVPGDILYLGGTAHPGSATCIEDDIRHWSPVLTRSYAWGAFNFSTWSWTNFRMVDCAYSFSEVEIELTLTGGNLGDLDMEQPPRVIEGTARKPQRDINVPIFYADSSILALVLPSTTLEDPTATSLVLGDFMALFKPFGGIHHTMVAEASQKAADTILESLNYNMRLTAAQLVNMESRLQVSDLAGPDRPPPVKMSIMQNDRKILVQNVVPTILIVSILALIALIHLWGLISIWIMSKAGAKPRRWGIVDLGMRQRIPSNAWNIASIASLLRESNMLAVLPVEVFWMPPSEAEAWLAPMRCRMCWLGDPLKGQRYFAVVFVGSSRAGGRKDKGVDSEATGSTRQDSPG